MYCYYNYLFYKEKSIRRITRKKLSGAQDGGRILTFPGRRKIGKEKGFQSSVLASW
jgi:hypothetical protein